MVAEKGSIEVICGSMFCGKTEELIRRLRRSIIPRQNVKVFKPAIDHRYNEQQVTSHAGMIFDAIPINSASEILKYVTEETDVVGIDEAQFFDEAIISVLQSLAEDGKRVIVSGLDLDFRGEPFASMPILMAMAEKVDKLQAICMVCGGTASRTQRLVNGEPAKYNDPVVIVGASEMYEARCRKHHMIKR